MATELLVDEIDEGKRLLEQLDRDGFEVTLAFRVKTTDLGPWHLYIASPSIDPGKVGEAYRRVYATLSRVPGSWISLSVIKLINDEVDPKLDEEGILGHPGVQRMLADQARRMADEWFRSRHPDALIEHRDLDPSRALPVTSESSPA